MFVSTDTLSLLWLTFSFLPFRFWNRRQREGIRPRCDAHARNQCRFGPQVYDELVAQFEVDPFPNSATVKMLAQKAGGTPKQISTWYGYERMDCTTARVSGFTNEHSYQVLWPTQAFWHPAKQRGAVSPSVQV